MDEQQPQNSRKRPRGQSHEATDAGAQRPRHNDPDQQHSNQALNWQVQLPHAPQHQPDPAAADSLPQQQHQQHVRASAHEHPTQSPQQQLQQQPPSLQQLQPQVPQAPLYPQGQPSAAAAAAALDLHGDTWSQYQADRRSKGAMSLGELLGWPLLPLPQTPKSPRFETGDCRFYPDNVVSAPEYFAANFSAARDWAAGQQGRMYKAPGFKDWFFSYPVLDEAGVVKFFEEAAKRVQQVMANELQRKDVYLLVSRRATPSKLVSFLHDAVQPTPAALPAAATPSASVAGSHAASASASASAAAAAAAAASRSRRSSRSSYVKPDLLLVERDPRCPPIPTIQGMQSLAGWLAAHPEIRPQQMQSATSRQWQQVPKLALRTPGNGKPVYVVEIKVPEKLVDAQGVPLRLDLLFQRCKDGVSTRDCRSAYSLLGQAFTYQVEFGVDVLTLSSYAVSWAMERCQSSPGDVYISNPIRATSHGPDSTLLLAILWAHLKGLEQLQEARQQVLQPIGTPDPPDYQPHHSNDDDSGGGDPEAHHRSPRNRQVEHLPPEFVSGLQLGAYQQSDAVQQLDQGLGTSWQPSQIQPTQQPLQLQPTQQQQQQESLLQQSVLTELPLVHANSLGIHPGVEVLGEGESAVVFRGKCGSLESAVKVLPSLREVMREAGLYKHCQQLQGVVIPEMRGIGQLAPAASGYGFLAVSIVDGVPLSTVCMSSSVRAAALSAVAALHGCGVVHGDLTKDNMMLLQQLPVGSSSSPSPQQARVMLIDLGRARLATAEERALELQRLQQKLQVAR